MEWKAIENYPNYEISNCGLVMNSRGNILKPGINKQTKYEYVILSNGKKKCYDIHRLVAIAFIPNPENKREVDHIDRCKTNNHVSNLRWTTPSENNQNTGVSCNNKLGIKKYVMINHRIDMHLKKLFVVKKYVNISKLLKRQLNLRNII